MSQIPGVFARLVYLASLRDANTGQYLHHGFAERWGIIECDRALRSTHRRVFFEWITSNLSGQKAELDLYCSGLKSGKPRLVESWSRVAVYLNFMPAETLQFEQLMYAGQFQALLEVLRREVAGSAAAPRA